MYVIPLVPLEDSKMVEVLHNHYSPVEVEMLHYHFFHYKVITDDRVNNAYE